MYLKTTALAILAAVFVLSCSTVQENTASGNYTNPNGSSELAVLMNELYNDAALARQQIALGQKPRLKADARKILTAAATEPEKVASPEYKALAGSYIESVKMLKKSSPALAAEQFKLMATACMNCHKTLCPGPTKRIQKLLAD